MSPPPTGELATDAADRSASGWRIVSTTAVTTRHAQAFMGREGSGYETKMSVVARLLEALTAKRSIKLVSHTARWRRVG